MGRSSASFMEEPPPALTERKNVQQDESTDSYDNRKVVLQHKMNPLVTLGFNNPLHKESKEMTLSPPTLRVPPRTSIDIAEVEKSVRRTSVVNKSRRTSVKKSRRTSVKKSRRTSAKATKVKKGPD